jgi:hypothetical protein
MTRATEVTSRVSASIDDIDISKGLSVNIVHIIGFFTAIKIRITGI